MIASYVLQYNVAAFVNSDRNTCIHPDVRPALRLEPLVRTPLRMLLFTRDLFFFTSPFQFMIY